MQVSFVYVILYTSPMPLNNQPVKTITILTFYVSLVSCSLPGKTDSQDPSMKPVRLKRVRDIYREAMERAADLPESSRYNQNQTIKVPSSISSDRLNESGANSVNNNTLSSLSRKRSQKSGGYVVSSTIAGINQDHQTGEDSETASENSSFNDGDSSSLISHPQLSIDGPASVSPGQEFDLNVRLNSAPKIVSAPFYLRYEPRYLKFVKASEGGFMKEDGKATSFMTSNDEKKGRIIVGSSRLGDREGISGSGTVMTVTFRASGRGGTRVYLENVKLTGADGKLIQTQLSEKTVEVE